MASSLPPTILGTIPLQQWWTIADCSAIDRAARPSAVVPNDGRPVESIVCTHRASVTLRDGSQGSVKLGMHTTGDEVIAGLAAQIGLVNSQDLSLFAVDDAGATRMLRGEEELMDVLVLAQTKSIQVRAACADGVVPFARSSLRSSRTALRLLPLLLSPRRRQLRRRIAVAESPLAKEEAAATAIDQGAHFLAFLDAARQLRDGEFELSEDGAVHLAALHLYSDFGEVIPDTFLVQASFFLYHRSSILLLQSCSQFDALPYHLLTDTRTRLFLVQAYVAPSARRHNTPVLRRIVAREHIAVCAELRAFPAAARRLRAQRSFLGLLRASQPLYGALATKVTNARIVPDGAAAAAAAGSSAGGDPIAAFQTTLALSPAGVWLLLRVDSGTRKRTIVHCAFDTIDGFTLAADGHPMLVLHARHVGSIILAGCELRPRDLHRVLSECAAAATARGTTGRYAAPAALSVDQPTVHTLSAALEAGAFHAAEKSAAGSAAPVHEEVTMSFARGASPRSCHSALSLASLASPDRRVLLSVTHNSTHQTTRSLPPSLPARPGPARAHEPMPLDSLRFPSRCLHRALAPTRLAPLRIPKVARHRDRG